MNIVYQVCMVLNTATFVWDISLMVATYPHALLLRLLLTTFVFCLAIWSARKVEEETSKLRLVVDNRQLQRSEEPEDSHV